MTVRKRRLLEDLEPFDDETQIMVRLPNGQLVSAKDVHWEWPDTKEYAVIVMETSDKRKGQHV